MPVRKVARDIIISAALLVCSSCAQSTAAQFSGRWMFDVERTISMDATLQQKIKEDPRIRAQLHKVREQASFHVFSQNGATLIETNDGNGKVKRLRYVVVTEELGQLVIDTRNVTSNDVRRMIISFFGANNMEVYLPVQNKRIAFIRED